LTGHGSAPASRERFRYGASPGDQHFAEPRQGEFWNTSFGAAVTLAELGGADAIVRFFRTGRELTAGR
jgi:hypothetical protein